MQDDRHIAALLGFSGPVKDEDSLSGKQISGERNTAKLADVFLRTLLKNLSFQVVSKVPT